MMFGKDYTQPVCGFSQMKDSFRGTPTYRKCELVVGLIYTWPALAEGKQWFDDQVRILKERYKLHFPDVPSCFVCKVLEVKSLPNVRNFFQYKDGCTGKGSRLADTSFGLTIKKSQTRSTGPKAVLLPMNLNPKTSTVGITSF